MTDRLPSALIVAATLWSLATVGNAQSLLGRRNSMLPASGPQPYAAASQAPAAYSPSGQYGAPGPYGASAGYSGVDLATAIASDPNRKLQAGDVLTYRIEQDREIAAPIAVSQTGDVAVYPLQSVHVAGLTLAQASGEIKRGLEKDYYYSATVLLTLERATIAQAGEISLSGYVARVGPIPLFADRPMTVSQAILSIGGFRQYANERKVKVTRVGNGVGKVETFIVDVKAVINEGKVDKDLTLQAGDRINVTDTFIKP